MYIYISYMYMHIHIYIQFKVTVRRITWFLIFTNPLNLGEDGWIPISASAFNLLKIIFLTEVHAENMISKQICNRKREDVFMVFCVIMGNAPKISKWSFSISFIIRRITIGGPPHHHAGLPHTCGSPPTGYMEVMLQWARPGSLGSVSPLSNTKGTFAGTTTSLLGKLSSRWQMRGS